MPTDIDCKQHNKLCKAKHVKWRGGKCRMYSTGRLKCSIEELMRTQNPKWYRHKGRYPSDRITVLK